MKRLNDIFKVFLLLSLTSFFVNCTIEDIDDVKSALPYLVIETDSVSFDNVNRYIEIPIKTNRELTIKTSYIDSSDVDSWLEASLSANSDTLRISVAEYNQDIRRRAILTLSSRNDLVDHKITVSQKGSFIPDWKPIDGVYNLSQNGTANCYIVPKSGEYAFYALTKGNSTLPVGDVSTVEVLWETRNTKDKVSVGQIISDVKFDNGYIYFEASGLRGNALIAVKDVTDTIIWSWHIWVTNYDPDENNCTYLSGAVMMDRNLGALNCGADPESFGFLYQWGRKDPLLGSADGSTTFATTAPVVKKQQVTVSNPVEYSFANPINLVDNLFNDSSAWGRTKTMYDPCPPGWRVPDGGYDGVWKGMIYGSPGITGGSHFGMWSIHPPYSTPETIYPAPGYTDGDCGLKLLFPGSALYCWSCDHISTNRAYGMHLFDRIERELNAAKEAEFSVRCMKDDGNSIPPAPEPDPELSDWYLTGDFNGWGLDDDDRMRDEGEFYVYRNLKLDSDGTVFIVRGMWEESVGASKFHSNTALDVFLSGFNIVPAGTYDVYLSSDLSKLYFMTDGKTPDQAAPAPDPNPSPSVDWTSDEVISYDLPEHASSHRQVLKNIKYLHDDENFYVKLQASAALFKESGTNYLSVFIFDDTNGSGNGYYGWWNNAVGNIEYFGEHVGVFTGTDLTLTIGSTPIPVEKEEYGDSLIWTLSIPRSAQSPLETRNPSFAFMTMCDWDPTGALPDKYDDMLEFYPSGDPDPEPAPVETTYTVTGTIQDAVWDNSAAVGLMTKKGDYYVAKNIPFIWAKSTTYGGDDELIKFQISVTGRSDKWWGVSRPSTLPANAEISVSLNTSNNIYVKAPEGNYDVYFNLEDEKVWVMEPGKRPGDDITSEKPGGTEGLPDEGYEWE